MAGYIRLVTLLFANAAASAWAAEDPSTASALTGETNAINPPPGMVAWWSGDSNALDLIGHNNGSLKNGAAYGTGKVEQAFSLANGAYIEIPDAAGVNYYGTMPMTVEFWAFRTGISPIGHIIAKRIAAASAEYQISFDPTTGLFWGQVGDDLLGHGVFSNVAMPIGTWCHVAGTYDGSRLSLFLNGQLIGSAQGSLGPFNSVPLRMGAIDYNPPGSFEGLIDEMCLFNRALTQSEILSIYQAGSAGKVKPGLDLPTITAQPDSQVVYPGANVFFTVTATGAGLLSYQWQKNGVDIPGATNPLLLLEKVDLDQAGEYTVVVSNALGSRMSKPASLTLRLAPTIVQQPENFLATWGKEASFTIKVVGTEPLVCQWSKDGVAVPNATNATFTLTDVGLNDAGKYKVTVSNSIGTTTSQEAFLRVNPAGVGIGLYAGVLLDGVVGKTYNILCVTNLAQTNFWISLTNVTLTTAVQLWVDPTANVYLPDQPRRFYLVSPAP